MDAVPEVTARSLPTEASTVKYAMFSENAAPTPTVLPLLFVFVFCAGAVSPVPSARNTARTVMSASGI
jgi:hypothetical protein